MPIQKLPQLMERRIQICNEIAGITSMRRGTLNEIYRQQMLKDGSIAKRGPFYNITTKIGKNKTVTTAVPKSELESVRREVENYKNFRALSDNTLIYVKKYRYSQRMTMKLKKTKYGCGVFV